MSFGPLVSTQWLANELGTPGLIVLDASAYLPNENRQADQEFLQGHIPGARFFDIEHFSDPETSLPHMVPAQGRFARLAGELGIDNAARIVVYDQKGLFSAARAWWLFRLFGHDQVAVLDGGLPKWQHEQRPLAQGPAAETTATRFEVSLRANLLRGLGDLLANLDSAHELVVDARASNRFRGDVPELRASVEPGHIPGSHNLPYAELLNADATFKTPEQLRERFLAAGVQADRPVVTSCGSGLTATILLLGLAVAGLPQGALYDGSWTEWGSRADTPKAKGD